VPVRTLPRMPRTPSLSADGLRHARMAAQLLHRPRRSGPAGLVRHLLGVQAQILPSAGLGLRARTDGLTADRVERARVRDRSIAWTWAMRGTLHLLAAEDVPWLVPLALETGVAQARRRLPELGITGDVDRAVRAVHRWLDRDGPLTRKEIDRRLRRIGYRPESYANAYLVWLGTPRQVVVFGPDRDGEKTYVLARDWLEGRDTLDRDAALAELAVRYLAAHGPATPADLVTWSGIRAGDAKRGWKAMEDRLVEVRTPGGPMWMLRSQELESPRGVVRLLPSFDEYLLGWKDRSYVADPMRWRRVHPGAGWYHPAVIADGQAVGTWKTQKRRNGLAVQVEPFSTLPQATAEALQDEARAIGRYLRKPVEVV
jgi:hypothetical protein